MEESKFFNVQQARCDAVYQKVSVADVESNYLLWWKQFFFNNASLLCSACSCSVRSSGMLRSCASVPSRFYMPSPASPVCCVRGCARASLPTRLRANRSSPGSLSMRAGASAAQRALSLSITLATRQVTFLISQRDKVLYNTNYIPSKIFLQKPARTWGWW